MNRRRFGWSLVLLACVVAAAGCSSRDDGGARALARQGSGVRLSPNPAFASARVTAILDVPGVEIATCRYQWSRNGIVIASATSGELEPSHFSKGDEIEVSVTIPAPAGGRARTLNGRARVVNTPPRLTHVTLTVTTVSGVPALQANVDCADPDGDSPTYTYRWFVNDALLEGAVGPSLPVGPLARGSRVGVEVMAHDDGSASPPVRSEPFSIDNHPPQFTSQPAASPPGGGQFQYHAMATDPDGDALGYELVQGPAGMTMDSAGNLAWTLPAGEARRGEFPVRIRATDARGGETTQDFTIHLSPATSPQ